MSISMHSLSNCSRVLLEYTSVSINQYAHVKILHNLFPGDQIHQTLGL